MFPSFERPKINPMELIKLFPNLKSNPVFYKCYYLYIMHKQSMGALALSEEAFTAYYSQDERSLSDFEVAADPEFFEQL
jgi:hypothetical protein